MGSVQIWLRSLAAPAEFLDVWRLVLGTSEAKARPALSKDGCSRPFLSLWTMGVIRPYVLTYLYEPSLSCACWELEETVVAVLPNAEGTTLTPEVLQHCAAAACAGGRAFLLLSAEPCG